MLFIYGDGHANHGFKNLSIPYNDYHDSSVSMHRVGRYNTIVNLNNNDHDSNSIICLVYGELDCRSIIQRHIDMGRDENDVISDLVINYFLTIARNIQISKKIIVTAIIPPTRQNEYETEHGPILGEFSFVGSDEDRVRYTKKINSLMKDLCISNEYIYFDPFDFYKNEDGTLKHELSDNGVHIGDNGYFIEEFLEIYNNIK